LEWRFIQSDTHITIVHWYIHKVCTYICNALRDILNFTPGPQGQTSPLGLNLAPRGEICPLGGIFTPLSVNTLYCLEEWRGEQRISPRGDNLTPRGQIHPWGTTKLRMGLWLRGKKIFCVRLQSRRSRVRIPPGCKVFRSLCIHCCCLSLIGIVIVCFYKNASKKYAHM
jgi:hypothetical protein